MITSHLSSMPIRIGRIILPCLNSWKRLRKKSQKPPGLPWAIKPTPRRLRAWRNPLSGQGARRLNGYSVPDSGHKMLDSQERRWIYQQAYLPEHLPDYVTAISGAKPYLHGSYLCFFGKQHLIFIGYPLGTGAEEVNRAYDGACDRFQPSTTAVIAPKLWFPEHAASRRAASFS